MNILNETHFLEICDIQGGTQPPKSKWSKSNKNGFIRMLQIRDFTQGGLKHIEYVKESPNLKLCTCDDILIGRYGASIGKILTGLSGAYNVAMVKLVFDNLTINRQYLMYYLNSNIFQHFIINTGGRAAQAGFNKNDLKQLKIPLPPLAEQKRIAGILDKAQELIDKRKQQLEQMDELVKSLFYDMFGDPVTNPMGWETGKIRDLAVKTQYGTSKKAHESEGKYPVLRMNNITYNGTWDFKSLKYADFNETEQTKYLVHKGELLFNRTNSKELVGKTAVFKESTPMGYAGYLVKLITNDKANSEYISAYLNSKHGKANLLNMAKSIVGMANINAEELKKIKILIPPISLQDKFAMRVETIEAEKEFMQKSLDELEDNFAGLMQKAFKGEL